MERRSSAVRADVKSPQGEDEDYAILDSTILDSHSPNLSPTMAMPRESSLAEAASNFPSDTSWTGFAVNGSSHSLQPSPVSQGFSRSRGQTLSGLPSGQAGVYSQTPANWQTNNAPDHQGLGPATMMDHLVDFNGNSSSHFAQTNSIHTSSAPTFDNLDLNAVTGYQNASGFPTSPQSCKEGWISASSSEALDFRNISQQVQTHSPTFAASTHLLRRDGIRKKNARFEIPAERNLRTIDTLINQTSDEQELKELKQQKRLLRNRQAALDSRQRKKQHTERLEEEKKHYTAVISELEDALSECRIQEAEWARTKEDWIASQQQYQQYIDALMLEKEEMVQQHTLETGELRKKNAILIDQLQRLEGGAVSHAPSSTGYSSDFPEFDHLTMTTWEDFPVTNEFSIEAEPRPEHNEILSTSKNEQRDSNTQEDKAVASGFLLMLLLCGAWMASRSSNSSSAVIPTIPDEMRLASATVLDNLYKGSGIALEGATPDSALSSPPSGPGFARPRTTLTAYEIASLSRPPLDSLHQRLTAPSQQQLREQAFSLTPSQYNELAPASAYHTTTLFNSHGARNVADVLGSTDNTHQGNVADTYARSLLRGKVSTQVLKDFARMVAESRTGPHAPCKSEQLG